MPTDSLATDSVLSERMSSAGLGDVVDVEPVAGGFAGGPPAVIDPAVSFTWAEVDLSHLWCSPHPPAAERFFAVYTEVTGTDAGWRDRMPLLHLRQLLALVAMFDEDWGSTHTVRDLLAPFRDR